PKAFRKLYFGMSLEEFAKVKKKLPSDDLVREKFRYRWLEKFGKKGDHLAAVYFFGEGEGKPLYEIVIYYKTIQARTKFLEKHFGPPNHNKVEWKFSTGEGFIMRAWNFEERLVIVGAVPGTEFELEKEPLNNIKKEE
ncbi:MAG: hypothetical protein AAF570_22775, partial [Bacteroidota bacterium]